MERFADLVYDVSRLWEVYKWTYARGMLNTIILALAATAIGCIIGLVCGILNTVPYSKNDNPVKKFFLKLVRIIVRVYVDVFRGRR